MRLITCLFIFLLLWFSVTEANADIPRATLTGTVVDASTGDPLAYANVFLSRTSWGAATDENGVFTIPNIPLGTYELVASYVGYRLLSANIDLMRAEEIEVLFRLVPEPHKAPELTVTADVPTQWMRDLEKFKDLFLGISENARQCRITNPEIISFDYDETADTFTASASEPIEVENRALGYTIFFYLEDFAAEEEKLVRYFGKTHFEPMTPKNTAEKKKWKDNRLYVYRGSLKHFLTTLIDSTFTQDGFWAFNASSISEDNTVNEIYYNTIRPSRLIAAGDKVYEKRLTFKNYIKVYYQPEGYDASKPEFDMTSAPGQVRLEDIMRARNRLLFDNPFEGDNLSAITLNTDTLLFNIMGYVYNPYHLTVHGYWAEQRLADELPADYSPQGE